MKKLLIVFLLSFSAVSLADTGPKFSEQISISLFSEKRPFSHVDSICAIVYELNGEDTACLHYTTEEYWCGPTLDKEDGNYILFTHDQLRSFRLIIFLKNKKYESEVIDRYPGNRIYYFEVEDEGLRDRSPLFHEYWYIYVLLLLVTIFVEVTLGLIWFSRLAKEHKALTYILGFSLVNIVTHFSLWFIYSHAFVPLFLLELLVVLIESLYWKFTFKISVVKALLISLFLNATSWLIGFLCQLWIP